MNTQIIDLPTWLQSPPGQYLLEQERAWFDRTVADIFGYHALQLGLPQIDVLANNRMSHRWLGLDHLPSEKNNAVLVTDPCALPFAENTLDLVALPHTLEFSQEPHAALREAARVLVPEGRLVISGFNPASLWGLSQARGRFYKRLGFGNLFLPEAGEFIAYWRLRDWLRLLNFEVELGQFACYRPAARGKKWLNQFAWMDSAGDRWWPIFGSVYFLVAVKRVHGARVVGTTRFNPKALLARPAAAASKTSQS